MWMIRDIACHRIMLFLDSYSRLRAARGYLVKQGFSQDEVVF